jgi:hypothetical protein
VSAGDVVADVSVRVEVGSLFLAREGRVARARGVVDLPT